MITTVPTIPKKAVMVLIDIGQLKIPAYDSEKSVTIAHDLCFKKLRNFYINYFTTIQCILVNFIDSFTINFTYKMFESYAMV